MGMPGFTIEEKIDAPVEHVWNVLADIGGVHAWNPSVESSHLTSDQRAGVGTSRHCDLAGKRYVKEMAVDWDPHYRLTMRMVDTNLPFTRADVRFMLRPAGKGTIVTVSPDYEVRFGALGRLLDRALGERKYRTRMHALLAGLKNHVEAAGPDESA
jgi:uncharacterized membrane protein